MERSTCGIIGGGPAGMVLGLLLAKAGVEVTVFEKHNDFLRDFRGDTVHPSTLSLLEDLGLEERFAELPQRRIERLQIPVGSHSTGQYLTLSDFSLLPIKYNYIAMVPQWDFLGLLTEVGEQEPTFTLRMNTEVTGLIRENGLVKGVRYRTGDGTEGEHRAALTVACDGRHSLVRELPELELTDFTAPMDVRWFRIPRYTGDPEGALGAISRRHFFGLFDRGDYFQVANIIAKDTDHVERDQPIDNFNRRLVEALPWLSDRRLVESWDDVKLLHVTLDRLRKWHIPGLLCIGDAAHAMSPIGGVGINLAVEDAVAAARYLAEPLRTGRLRRRDVAAVQRRRWLTTAAIQFGQRTAHNNLVVPALRGDIDFQNQMRLPLPLRIANALPWVRMIPAYMLAYGAMRERPPAAALR